MRPVTPSVVSPLLEPPDLLMLSLSRLPPATLIFRRDRLLPPPLLSQISWLRFTRVSSTSIFFSGSAFDSRRIISLPGNSYTVNFSSASPKIQTLWSIQAILVTPSTSASISVSMSDGFLTTTISRLLDLVVGDLVSAEHGLACSLPCPSIGKKCFHRSPVDLITEVEPLFPPRLGFSSTNWNGSPTINGRRLLCTQNAEVVPRVSSGPSLGIAGIGCLGTSGASLELQKHTKPCLFRDAMYLKVAGFMASSSVLSYRVAYLCVGTRYPLDL
ncbi:hypothetical protein ISN44_As10g003680 [Arabidopsis suecica]|uniref:Uncharacterized protein n=1 Tax=Arabidopsis suecica TaxID=45249 RepID=A0A8T1ZS14_ARASU|nr:hypothetical protein ISN44_As10g003680 [Arabidopsis suecica]